MFENFLPPHYANMFSYLSNMNFDKASLSKRSIRVLLDAQMKLSSNLQPFTENYNIKMICSDNCIYTFQICFKLECQRVENSLTSDKQNWKISTQKKKNTKRVFFSLFVMAYRIHEHHHQSCKRLIAVWTSLSPLPLKLSTTLVPLGRVGQSCSK